MNFFVAKSTWPVRLRHANLSSTDDASVDIRSASIKFSDSNEGGPFDMIMNTGQGGVFWNLPTLQDRINAALAKDKVASQNEWLRKKPCNYAISCETLRRAPQSYTDQRYYSQLVYEFKAKDGKKRYVKYRLTPYDDIPETGLLSPEDQMQITKDFGKKDPNETRPFDYLRQEFKNKVDGPEGVHYRFQLQLHDWTDGDSYEYFNPNKPWDLKTHPWIDIGFIDLDKTLPEETIQNTCYNIANHPPSLGIIKPTSPEDYNSVAYARTKIYPISQWIRNHVHKEKGELKNPCEYFISAQTGNLKNAGTNANVSVTLYGTRGVTSNAALDIPWKDDRERGSKDNYIIKVNTF
jgi:arachidonate 5-lipoxygenase